MAAEMQHNENQDPASEAASTDSINGAFEQGRMLQIRHQIGLIANRSYQERLISREAYQGYRELAEGMEGRAMDLEMLENTRKFAEQHEEKAWRLHQMLQQAIAHKYASETDEAFLMENLVTDNTRFIQDAGRVETLVFQKLERMKKDKQRYEKLAGHELIKDIGYLKVDGNTRITFPNEEAFLSMAVPERRKLLDELEKSLPTAELFAREQAEREDKKLTEIYTAKLDAAVQEGIIGSHTYNSFLNGFGKIDADEKKYWDKEFSNQMKRYRELWNKVDSTLEGQALTRIKAMRDTSGYTEIFNAFTRICQTESLRLKSEYGNELQKYRQQGIIGQHTVSSFSSWLSQQDLKGKYEALKRLPEQMERYEELWEAIGNLPESQQEEFREKSDDWGYTELNQCYMKRAAEKDMDEMQGYEGAISQIRSKEVRDAIVETEEMLAEEGEVKRSAMINFLDRIFHRSNKDTFDASSFEEDVREEAAHVDPDLERDGRGRAAMTEVDEGQIENDAEVLKEGGRAKKKKESGFTEIQTQQEEGRTRHTQVTVNSKSGVDRLLKEDRESRYCAREDGGKDNISLAVGSGGRTVEMEMSEVRALQEHLKEKRQEKEKGRNA